MAYHHAIFYLKMKHCLHVLCILCENMLSRHIFTTNVWGTKTYGELLRDMINICIKYGFDIFKTFLVVMEDTDDTRWMMPGKISPMGIP